MTPANYPGMGCFPAALPVCATTTGIAWNSPTVLTAPAAGSKCYFATGPLIGTSMTITMSAWTYTGWTAQLFNGNMVGTSTYMGDLTPGTPAIALSLPRPFGWWIKVISTGPGQVTIRQT